MTRETSDDRTPPGPLKIDRHERDVLVAGSGAAGFAAAITAAHVGHDVLMVEKEPLFGGTTTYSAGVVWIQMKEASVAAGNADSET